MKYYAIFIWIPFILLTFFRINPDTRNESKSQLNTNRNDTTLSTLDEIKESYKKDGFSLLLIKEHKYLSIDNLLLVFDNKKIDHSDSVICKRILVICQNKNGKYLVLSNNNSIAKCSNDCCPIDDGFMNIYISQKYISVYNQYHDNEGRNVTVATFKYSVKDKDYILHRYRTELYHRENPEIRNFSKVMTVKDFGRINFKNYDSEKIGEILFKKTNR